jgi:hypothetical protein
MRELKHAIISTHFGMVHLFLHYIKRVCLPECFLHIRKCKHTWHFADYEHIHGLVAQFYVVYLLRNSIL